MKRFSNHLFLLALGLLLGSCESFVEGLEVDPNNPADADAVNTIQGVILSDVMTHEGEAARISAIWTAQFTGADRQNLSVERYDVNAGNFDGIWSTAYYGVIAQARLTARNAEQAGIFKLQGVAQVLEAHTAGTLTGLFGDVPFRQAANRNEYPNPAFDSQAQIYADLQGLLKQAIKNLDRTGGGIPAARDIIFNGDATKWKATAYTLKARYFLYTKQYDSARIAANRGISSTANSMQLQHKDVEGAQNVYCQYFQERGGDLSGANSYAARLLAPNLASTVPGNHNNAQTNEQARFNFYFTPSSTGNYGLQNCFGFSDPEARYPLVTYGENQLIIAEANARLNNNDAALNALNAHRRTLTSIYGGGRYNNYTLATLPGTGTDNAKLLREILLERYLFFIGQTEAFMDARRTNNALNLPIKRQGASSLPQRFIYPQTEINTNSVSIPTPLPGLYDKTPVNQ